MYTLEVCWEKMGNYNVVALDVLIRIATVLHCQVGDLIEIIAYQILDEF